MSAAFFEVMRTSSVSHGSDVGSDVSLLLDKRRDMGYQI